MKIRIYQIDLSLDEQHVAFRSHTEIQNRYGGRIPAELYCKTYEGTVEAEDLEDVFYIFNMDHPADYRARSLSMSDVVEIVDDYGSSFHICDTFGFKEVSFDASLLQGGPQNG